MQVSRLKLSNQSLASQSKIAEYEQITTKVLSDKISVLHPHLTGAHYGLRTSIYKVFRYHNHVPSLSINHILAGKGF